jgi:hypothetical protein
MRSSGAIDYPAEFDRDQPVEVKVAIDVEDGASRTP